MKVRWRGAGDAFEAALAKTTCRGEGQAPRRRRRVRPRDHRRVPARDAVLEPPRRLRGVPAGGRTGRARRDLPADRVATQPDC